MTPAPSTLREALGEVLAAADYRDAAGPPDPPPPALTPERLARIAHGISFGGRSLVSLPTAARSGVDVEALRQLVERGHLPHRRELGLLFVAPALVPPAATVAALLREGTRGPHRPGRVARNVRADTRPLLALAAELLLERRGRVGASAATAGRSEGSP